MSKLVQSFVLALVLVSSAFTVFGQTSTDGVWAKTDESRLAGRNLERVIVPDHYETFRLNKTALQAVLERAPEEFSAGRNSEVVLSLPMPDGKYANFRIVESSIMAPELAAKFPEIKSYLGYGIDDKTASVRFDLSPNGFRAMVISAKGTSFIEPYAKNDNTNYIAFDKHQAKPHGRFECLFENDSAEVSPSEFGRANSTEAVINGTQLRTYRLAIAVTGEYTNIFRQPGDTDAQAKTRAMAAMNTTMNRVNSVYERELSIRMIFIANNDLIIYTDPDTDPYNNTSTSATLTTNQTNIDNVIGSPNYDIGHIFSTADGGIAQLRSPCGSGKARGATGLPNPVGDPFDIDYVAHEMGHQFGANHTMNGCSRTASAAYEPGSGVTIMGYAGICGAQNLARNSIDTFHVKSLEEIVAFITTGTGTCSVNTATNNTPPTVAAVGPTSYNIPKNTPFVLNATATDANGDSVTYDWQQYDLGAGTSAVPNSDLDGNARPIFRVYLPTTGGARNFPSMQYVLNNANTPPSTYTCNNSFTCLTGELLPQITRTMNFQVVARDNRAGGGAINTTTVQVMVDGNSGPFKINAPNTATSWNPGSTQTVTWDVANSAAAPINAATVRILLSTDGGQTFPTVLVNSTANDGSESVVVPNTLTSSARIKIEAIGNIFFDISDVNFSIAATPVAAATLFDFDGDRKADVSVFRADNATWYLQRSQAGFAASQFGNGTDTLVPADFDGDGKTDIAVFRAGNWFIVNSSNNQFRTVNFGLAGDTPVPADYDGDSKADVAVFRAGNWYFLDSSNNQFRAVQFGLATDKLVPADYDGDNKADVAVFRDGNWYIQRSQAGFTAVNFGLATDKLVVGDYDGDRKADQAVYRNGTWYINRSQLGFTAAQFGNATDIPVPADFDGDGKTDPSVFRAGNWYMLGSTSGFTAVQFGNATDKAVPASYVP